MKHQCTLDGETIFVPIEDPDVTRRLERSGRLLTAASWKTNALRLVVSFQEIPGMWFDYEKLRQPLQG